ncbi:MAG: hypothetical protein ACFFAT_10830 [Promethearchaeota archaeon]
MPSGTFVILMPTDSDYKVLGYYFTDKRVEFEVTSDLFLRLNLDHSKNEYNFLKLKNLSLVSYLHNFKGRLSRKASGMILGLLLDEDEKPEKFRTSLKNAASAIEITDFISLSREDFEKKLEEIYVEHLETLIESLDPALLNESIINRAKEMLSGNKKDRQIADELLEKIQNKEHEKISEFYKQAEEALNTSDYDKAAKFFGKAAEVAEDLLEKDLAKTLKHKSKISNKIPLLTKNREKMIQDARAAIRTENFHSAYIFFKKAAELSKELMEADKEEEYNLKSQALKDYYTVDQKYGKK